MYSDDKKWKREFYRFLDSYKKSGNVKTQLQTIEEDIFENIRGEIETEFGHTWSGSKEENRVADMKISSAIKSSFRS